MSYFQPQPQPQRQQQPRMAAPRPRRPAVAGGTPMSSFAGQQQQQQPPPPSRGGTYAAAVPPLPGSATAAAASYGRPTPMTGRVILDRTSFDSEDRITTNHLAPHSSDSTGGPSLASFRGAAATGGGSRGDPSAVPSGLPVSAAQPTATAVANIATATAPPKKLRRRKMNWKPRLPSSSSSSDNNNNNASSGTKSSTSGGKVTFQRATDDSTIEPDDMSYLGVGGGEHRRASSTAIMNKGGGGKGGGGQASVASTNATPKLSNGNGNGNGNHGRLLSGFGRSRGANNNAVASGDDNSTLATLETPVHRTGGGSSAQFSPYGERRRGGNNNATATTPTKSPASGQQGASSPATPGARSTSSTAPLEESFNSSLDHSGYSTPGRSGIGGAGSGGEKQPLPPRAPPMTMMGAASTTPPGALPTTRSSSRISPSSSQRMRGLSSRVESNSSLSDTGAGGSANVATTGSRNRADNSTSIGAGGGSGSDNLLRLDDTDGPGLVGDRNSSMMMSMSPISRELAMLQAQSEGNILTPSRQQQQQGQGGSGKAVSKTKSAPSPATSRSRFASAAGPVDVDSAQFTDAERHLRAIHEMGAEHLIHGEFDEAVEVFTEILRGQMERHGPDHPRVGTALHNLGICHLKKGDYASAIRVCRDAVEVRKAALGGRHLDVAVSLAQLGIAHLECGQHRKALIAFREALQIRRSLLGPKHPKVARLLNNTGCALFELDEMRGAMLAFEETLDIQRSMMKLPDAAFGDEGSGGASSSAAEQLLLSTAATLCNIGSIRLRLGDADGALVALEEALLVQQSVLGDDHQIVLATSDSIDFIESKRSGSLPASGDLSIADGSLSRGPSCARPALLSRLINANVIQSIGKGGKNLFQRMEELTLEQMACGGGIDRSDAQTQFSI